MGMGFACPGLPLGFLAGGGVSAVEALFMVTAIFLSPERGNRKAVGRYASQSKDLLLASLPTASFEVVAVLGIQLSGP